MLNTPQITIWTPVWNGLPFLPIAAESIFSQSEVNWRWIISDNGSTDGTLQYLSDLQARDDSRIQIFFQPENLGILGNLNFLCRKTKTSHVQILCSDDYFSSPNSLAQIIYTWRELDSTVGAIRWNWNELDNAPRVPHLISPNEGQLLFFLHGNLMGNLSNASARLDELRRAGDFNQTFPYAGDFEFWARFAQGSSVFLSDKQLVYVRRHPGAASNYLNRHGELFSQLAIITSGIYLRINSNTAIARLLLRVTGVLVYDCVIRKTLLLKVFRGTSVPLKALDSSYFLRQYRVNRVLHCLLFSLVFFGGFKLLKKPLLSITFRSNRLPSPSNH